MELNSVIEVARVFWGQFDRNEFYNISKGQNEQGPSEKFHYTVHLICISSDQMETFSLKKFRQKQTLLQIISVLKTPILPQPKMFKRGRKGTRPRSAIANAQSQADLKDNSRAPLEGPYQRPCQISPDYAQQLSPNLLLLRNKQDSTLFGFPLSNLKWTFLQKVVWRILTLVQSI